MDVKVLQGYFGRGWEDLEQAYADDLNSVKELKDDMKSYQENDPRAYRIITRKEENPDYRPELARKSPRTGGVAVVVNLHKPDEEVWFSDKYKNIDFMYDNYYIQRGSVYGDYLTEDGYKFLKQNFVKLDKNDYEFRKRYSYYALYLQDGQRVENIIYAKY